MVKRRAPTSTRTIDEQEAREHRDLDAQVERQMAALSDQFDRGRHDGEPLEQLGKRLIAQFAAFMHRVARRQREIFFDAFDRHPRVRTPRGRGRPRTLKLPPTLLTGLRLPQKSGRPTKFTPEIEQGFLARIDAEKVLRAAEGLSPGDSAALRSDITRCYVERYVAEGRPLAEALRLAKAKANGPLFRTRKRQLTALRRRERDHSPCDTGPDKKDLLIFPTN